MKKPSPQKSVSSKTLTTTEQSEDFSTSNGTKAALGVQRELGYEYSGKFKEYSRPDCSLQALTLHKALSRQSSGILNKSLQAEVCQDVNEVDGNAINVEGGETTKTSFFNSVFDRMNARDADFWCAEIPGFETVKPPEILPRKGSLSAFLDAKVIETEIHTRVSGADDDSTEVSDISGLTDIASGKPIVRHKNGRFVRCSVRFSEITVRSYERVVDDNPSCPDGPSVSLGWSFREEKPQRVDDYEGLKSARRVKHLSAKRRVRILQEWGFSGDDIAASVRQISKVRKQRAQTLSKLGTNETFVYLFQSARSGVQRVLPLPKKNWFI